MCLLTLSLLRCQLPEPDGQDISPNDTISIKDEPEPLPQLEPIPEPLPEPTVQQRVIAIAGGYVGVREVGKNTSPEIDRWLRSVNLRPGNPYCAAFVSYILDSAHVSYPKIRSGLARNFVTNRSIPASRVMIGIEQIPEGSIVVWRRGNTIFGHAGFVTSWQGASGTTIEANTSSGEQGSQSDGDGVYRRTRTIIPSAHFRITDFTVIE